MRSLPREALTIEQRLSRIYQALHGASKVDPGPWFESARQQFFQELLLETSEDCVFRTPRWFPLRPHDGQLNFLGSDKRFNIVPSGRRSGKCVAAGTLVAMADGTFKPVERILAGEMVLSVNDNYELEPKAVQHVHENGTKETVKIRTSSRSVVTTLNHPFLANNTWTEAHDVKIKDLVGVPKHVSVFAGEAMDGDELDFLAIWLAEGSNYTVSNTTPEIVEVVQRIAEKWKLKIVKWSESDMYLASVVRGPVRSSSEHPARRLLERLWLWGKTSKTKFIPECVFRLPRNQLARFLNLFFACDGSIYPKSTKSRTQYSVSVGLANERMTKQIGMLLHKFGIRSHIRHKKHKAKGKNGKHFESWELTFTESAAVELFCSEIGAIGKEDRCKNAIECARESSGTCNQYLPISIEAATRSLDYEPHERSGAVATRAAISDAPPKLLRELNHWRKQSSNRISTKKWKTIRQWTDSRFDNMVDGDVAWEEVVSISSAGSRQTYDLTIEDNHNFIANGFVTHNTECAKRRLVMKAISGNHNYETLYVAAAPTFQQAKRIYWRDLKRLVPQQFMAGKPAESDLAIDLLNGAQIVVTGMDRPERVEGPPVAHFLVDEYADMRPESWSQHMRPALADTQGTADLIGVPNGRGHYYDLWLMANTDDAEEWGAFHWFSADILPRNEIEAARKTMDPRTFKTEFEGSFEDFAGRAYYCFELSKHCKEKVEYNPRGDLIFCFDFNVSPGCAVVLQEFAPTSLANGNSLKDNGAPKTIEELLKEDRFSAWKIQKPYTGIIGEVWIRDYSNTPLVCQKLIAKHKDHKGMVYCYGDPAGGARHTQGGRGTDWEIINQMLGAAFPGKVKIRVKKKAPPERDRINAVNARLMSEDGTINLRIDPKCQYAIKDFEGVACDDHGHIDKTDKWLTHLSDAVGYYIEHQFPVKSQRAQMGPM